MADRKRLGEALAGKADSAGEPNERMQKTGKRARLEAVTTRPMAAREWWRIAEATRCCLTFELRG